MSEWQIEDRDAVEIDEPVHTARIELVSGTVDVVSTDGPSRVEVEVLAGPPVTVALDNGELRVRYEEPARLGLPDWVRRGRREARVSIAVPADTRVHLGVVDAEATVAGLTTNVRVDTVSGRIVLDDLGDGVKGSTVSGELQLRGVAGPVEVDSVSGDLTVVDGRMSTLRADSVSGGMTVDLPDGETETVHLSSVSGDLVLRAPVDALGRVRMSSTSGRIDAPGDLLVVRRKFGSTRAECNGDGHLEVEGSTVSGAIVVVDRPHA